MKNMVDDWNGKQGILITHIVEEPGRIFLGPLQDRIKKAERDRVIAILEKYNELLQEGGYVDDDIWCKGTTTIDQFLLKYYPKI